MPEILDAPPTELMERLTAGLDKVAPMPKSKETPPPTETPPAKVEIPPAEVKPKPADTPAAEERPLPAFLEKKGEQPPTEIKVDEWPEELPSEKDPKKQADYKKWRTQYKERGDKLSTLEKENLELKNKGQVDAVKEAEVEQLRTQNKKYQDTFDKVYVEESEWFQNTFVKPREQLLGQAKDVVKEVEGNPEVVDKLVALQGKSYWDELDKVTEGLPEAAKISLTQIVNSIRSGDKNREKVLSNSREAAVELRKAEFQSQRQTLEKQTVQQKQVFDDLITEMREKHGLEVLTPTTDPKEAWWNTDVVQKIQNGARDVLFNNQDVRKLQAAVILGHAADQYRDMWIRSEQARGKLQKELEGIRGAEPNLEETGGISPNVNEDDTKKPLGAVFRKLLEQQRQS